MPNTKPPAEAPEDSPLVPRGSLLLSQSLEDRSYEPDALDVRISDLLVGTADGGDPLIAPSVFEVLQLLREHMKMDVTFISEFVNGHRVFRRVQAAPGRAPIREGESDPLDQSLCQCVVNGRMPRLVPDFGAHERSRAPGDALPQLPLVLGAHLSVPIVLHDGQVYGTLCCFSHAPNPELSQRDLRKLELTARLIAQKIEAHEARITPGAKPV